jgi:hypothetical protein
MRIDRFVPFVPFTRTCGTAGVPCTPLPRTVGGKTPNRPVGPCAGVLAVLLVLSGPVSAQNGPVRLSIADANAIAGRAYTLTFSQDAALEAGADTHLMRDARFRFRFGAGERISEQRSSSLVVFDSARAAVTSPHGREVIDARPLMGRSVPVTWAHSGGPAEWEPGVAIVDFGDFGTPQPVSALIDYVFPALDARAVRTGDSWERGWQRRMIDGNRWTETDVITRLKLDRLESHGGVTLARITFRTDAVGDRGPSASGSIVLGVEDGVVREVVLEDLSSGEWSFGEDRVAFEQTTTLRLTLDGEVDGHGLNSTER